MLFSPMTGATWDDAWAYACTLSSPVRFLEAFLEDADGVYSETTISPTRCRVLVECNTSGRSTSYTWTHADGATTRQQADTNATAYRHLVAALIVVGFISMRTPPLPTSPTFESALTA